MAAAVVSTPIDATPVDAASVSAPTPVKRVPVLPKYRRTMETDFLVEFPVLKRDVRIRVEGHDDFLLTPEVAGVFGYCHECDEMTDDDASETLVDCFASFPANGLVQLLRLVDVIRSNPGYERMTLGYPIGHLASRDTFCLMRYGFPQWAVDLFESSFFTTTDIFDMIVTADFLRSPVIKNILLLRVASYINTIPDNVYIACFVPTPSSGEAPKIELPYEQTKAILEAHPWLADKADASFIQDDTILEETRRTFFKNRSGGPDEDLPLIEGLQRISLTTYKQIWKFV